MDSWHQKGQHFVYTEGIQKGKGGGELLSCYYVAPHKFMVPTVQDYSNVPVSNGSSFVKEHCIARHYFV